MRSLVLRLLGTTNNWLKSNSSTDITNAIQTLILLWDITEQYNIPPPTEYLNTIYAAQNAIDTTGTIDTHFIGHTSFVTSVAFSPDGTKVLTGSYDNTAVLWDLKGNQLSEFKRHNNWVNAVAFSPDGMKVLTGSYDNTAILWDLEVACSFC